MHQLAEIISAIEALTPAQRRKLQLRLHASGLFVPEDLLTDKNKLAVAPAIGVRRISARQGGASESPTPPSAAAPTTTLHSVPQVAAKGLASVQPTSAFVVTPPAGPTTSATPVKLTMPESSYRPPVSGKVVVGPPTSATTTIDPHAMPPVPGQAPEQAIAIVFDGGSKGNPGEGYGSYQLLWPGTQPQVVRLRFGDRVTNNEAEYDTLIAALDAVVKRLEDSHADPTGARIDIRGDSLLVVNQVMGKWQCKEERMQERRDHVRALLKRFGQWRLSHHDRSNSVKALGH